MKHRAPSLPALMARLAPLALAAALLAPAAASAQPVGSSHQGPLTQLGCGTGLPCVFLQNTVAADANVNVVPGAGRLTGFAVRGVDGPFRFVVLRGASGSLAPVAQTGDIEGNGSDSLVGYSFDQPVAVQAGDAIALRLASGSRAGLREASGDGNTNLFQLTDLVDLLLEAQGPYELFLSADFEPNPVPLPTPVNPGQPAPGTEVTPDPLASLKAGARPAVTVARGPVAVSRRRRAQVTISNPNAFAIRGTLTVSAGRLGLGSTRIALPAKASKAFALTLSRKAMATLRRKRRLRATAVAKLKGPVGRAATIRRVLTFKAPAKARKKQRRAPGKGKEPGSGTGGSPVSPRSNRWAARQGSTGDYDDFKFTLDGDQINLTEPELLFASCSEIGGQFRVAASQELFNLLGPWRLGNQSETQQQQSVAVNTLVTSGQRTITYKLTSTREASDRITGKLTMTFSDSRYDIFTNKITFINCAGTTSFEAVPE